MGEDDQNASEEETEEFEDELTNNNEIEEIEERGMNARNSPQKNHILQVRIRAAVEAVAFAMQLVMNLVWAIEFTTQYAVIGDCIKTWFISYWVIYGVSVFLMQVPMFLLFEVSKYFMYYDVEKPSFFRFDHHQPNTARRNINLWVQVGIYVALFVMMFMYYEHNGFNNPHYLTNSFLYFKWQQITMVGTIGFVLTAYYGLRNLGTITEPWNDRGRKYF